MIFIETDDLKNTDDIHALTKAFFPREEVRITLCDDSSEDMSHPVIKPTNSGKSRKLVYKSDRGAMFEVDIPEDSRDELKRSVYNMLSFYTGRTLPWGALTGIRPTRLARKRIDAGMNENEILADMKRCYLASDEKILLSIEIAKREIELMRDLRAEDHYSLYVDVPFCPTRCLYCSFTSNAVGKDRSRVASYLDALEKEIKACAGLMKSRRLDTVYVGGGTPTALLPDELDRLLGVLEYSFNISNVREITVEAGRPDSITREKLEVLKAFGVSRISVNPQTMNQRTLDTIGRRHTVEQVREAFYLARETGFDNINMDIILGLPGEDRDDVAHTTDEICRLAPDSVTIHTLALKRAAAMKEWIDSEGYDTEADTDEMMSVACGGAAGLGMHPYYLYRQKNMTGNLENTGYAKEGKYGLYNILINEEVQDILALGAGAISKRVDAEGSTKRSANFKEVKDYAARVDEMIERKRELFGKA
ncbi:MAG: coproporphyrinogen dehydrogenase HemZ [Lachnospiraceae bacterium]|nr:coproporphyrinogen dehydrogenase HemZ [Lachnospiraceae bacterium]